MNKKPLGRRNYGSIGHLPGSRTGPADHHCDEGHTRIATVKARPGDTIIVTEKLDGTNVGVCRLDNKILALQRRGYLANSSPRIQHHYFAQWVEQNQERFLEVLKEGERICGEWLLQAHGTKYELSHEPFVVFDLFTEDNKRLLYDQFTERASRGELVLAKLLHRGAACSIERAQELVGEFGHHGAIEAAEGAVWKVERDFTTNQKYKNRQPHVEFLAKFVRKAAEPGKYLPDVSGGDFVWNIEPSQLFKS